MPLIKIPTSTYFLSLLWLLTSSCSIPYYTSAGYHQARILMSRRSIQTALEDKNLDPELTEKLKLTLAAREYAKSINLNPGKTFLSYATRENIPKSWIVIAAEPLELKVYEWSFPIVGNLPYKGFFSPEEANEEIEFLETLGYDVAIRTSAAYSTLGWFDDPVLPSTLNLEPLYLFNTVVHEIVHTSFWIKNHVSFNETMANAIGYLGAAHYFHIAAKKMEFPSVSHDDALNSLLRECQLAQIFAATKLELETLFNSDQPKEFTLKAKTDIYQNLSNKIRALYQLESKQTPETRSNLNNATFLAQYTYLDQFQSFLELYLEKGSLKEMIDTLLKLSEIPDSHTQPLNAPYIALQAEISPGKNGDICSRLAAHFTGPS